WAAARAASGTEEGGVAEKSALTAGRKSLLAILRKRGFYEANVDANESSAGDAVTLRYAIQLGPLFELEVGGNERVASTTLLDLSDLADRPIVTRGTWQMI